MFEYVGEHAQAASLRLEHADTLRDERQRLAVLREGCARNPAGTEQGQALHRALGEALLRVAEGIEPGVRRRALALEAAQALEAGQRHGQAGRLYERLGLLSRAAKAFTEAGDIDRLEAIYARLEQRQQRQRELRELELEVETALSTGRRSLAETLLRDHIESSERSGRTAPASLTRLRQALEARRIRDRCLELHLRLIGEAGPGPLHLLRVVGREQLRLGRGPHCELRVQGAALSRTHAELAVIRGDDGGPQLAVRDLGSRAGTFIDGQALAPGEDWSLPLPEPPPPPPAARAPALASELALGIAAAFDLAVLRDGERPLALLRAAGLDGPSDSPTTAWTLFAPLGGPVYLDPDHRLPLALGFEGPHSVLACAPQLSASLGGTPLGPGAVVELLLGDQLELRAGDFALELELRELRR